MNWKELYMQASVLLGSKNPSNHIAAANILHRIVYAKSDGTNECNFWKGYASIDLANIFLAGIESVDYYDEEDDKIYADCYIEADLLKAYDLYRRALMYGNHDGIVVIAEIYYMLGDYTNAAKMYASVIKFDYKGAENAKKILDEWLRKGKIKKIPEVTMEPSWDPIFEFYCPE